MTEMGKEGRTNEPIMNLDQVQQFIRENVIPTKEGRRCVDGRYEMATDDSGMIARPGGDLGYSMVLLAQGLSPEQAFDSVYNVVTQNGGNYYLHTDKHSDPEGEHIEGDGGQIKIGCGHAAKPMDPNLAPAYGVNPEEVAHLVTLVKQKAHDDPKVKITNLNGDHAETGVIVINGQRQTINPQNLEGVQFFVYDQTRDEDFMRRLVESLNLPGISYEQFKSISDQQLQATLHNLAKGKTIYQVNTDDTNFPVQIVGTVE